MSDYLDLRLEEASAKQLVTRAAELPAGVDCMLKYLVDNLGRGSGRLPVERLRALVGLLSTPDILECLKGRAISSALFQPAPDAATADLEAVRRERDALSEKLARCKNENLALRADLKAVQAAHSADMDHIRAQRAEWRVRVDRARAILLGEVEE